MSDVREDILARLEAVLKGVPGYGLTVQRNPLDVPESARPFAALFDGDEEVDRAGANQQPARAAALVMTMRPGLYLVDRKSNGAVGQAVNALRAAVIKAVMADVPLASLTYNGTGVSYEGCATSLARGRSIEADIDLRFAFTYRLRPDQL